MRLLSCHCYTPPKFSKNIRTTLRYLDKWSGVKSGTRKITRARGRGPGQHKLLVVVFLGGRGTRDEKERLRAVGDGIDRERVATHVGRFENRGHRYDVVSVEERAVGREDKFALGFHGVVGQWRHSSQPSGVGPLQTWPVFSAFFGCFLFFALSARARRRALRASMALLRRCNVANENIFDSFSFWSVCGDSSSRPARTFPFLWFIVLSSGTMSHEEGSLSSPGLCAELPGRSSPEPTPSP